MAAAKKCDICGRLYYDCCPNCIKSILEHINSLKKKEE